MRAIVLRRPGGPEVLQAADLPSPRPTAGELRIRVRAAGVNRLDAWIRAGTYRVPYPHVLGADVAGEVIESEVSSRYPPGTRVLVYPGLFCGKCAACRKGRESLCPTFGLLGRDRYGGYAEELTSPEANVVPLPSSVPWPQAGATPVAFLTAEHAVRQADLLGGESVLVFGATGGLGQALMARADRRGARILAVTRTPQAVPQLRVAGADEVLMFGANDLSDRVRALTRGHGVEVVLDPLGQEAVAPGLKALAQGGRYLLLGATSGAKAELDLRSVYQRQLTVRGGFLGDLDEFRDVVQELGRGRIQPQIFRELPLSEAAEAHRLLEAPHLGKVVLLP